MIKTTPKISVVLPVRNSEIFLEQAIESVLNQSFQDFELIIIDDYSSDNSLKIIQSYRKKDNRIQVLINESNLGIAGSLNKGISKAKGYYIARMDGDDICFQERFAKQVKFLDEHPEVYLLGCNTIRIDANGKFINRSNYPQTDSLIRYTLFFHNAIAHPTVMIRSILFTKHNYEYRQLSSGQDFDLWTRITDEFKFWNLPDFLYYHRRHSASVTSTKNGKALEKPMNSQRLYIKRITGVYLTMHQLKGILAPQQIESLEDARLIIRVLLNFTQKSLKSCSLNIERVYIRRETARLIMKIWGYQNRSFILCPYLVKAILLDPRLLLKKIFKS